MAHGIQGVFEGLAGRWKSMKPANRFFVGCMAAGLVATVFVTLLLVRHVSYSVLYTGMETDQASGVVDELRDMKVRFRLEDSGRTILVPEGDVYALRLELAGKGLPGGGKGGYEIFDQNRFGMTNFMQQVNYRRALEGELTRTIQEMEEVMAARVHLVIPERTLFVDDTRRPSASVMLRLKPGVRLVRKQIEGIAFLVAGSVEGLETGQVNIVDYHGNLLSEPTGDDPFDSGGSARFELQAAVGQNLERRAQTLLDQVLGPGKSVVRISAELENEMIERNEERFDPDATVPRSEETNEAAGGPNGEESVSSVTNYEVSKVVERVVSAPGNIRRLTVAVSVDGSYTKREGAAKGEEPAFVPRGAEELRQLGALVRNAVGIDDSRGDKFHIACVRFDQSHLEVEQQEMQKAERNLFWQAIAGKAVLVLGAAVILFVLYRIFRSISRTLAQASTAPRPGGAGENATAAEIARLSLTSRVSELTRTRPEESAELIRTMVGEEK